MYIYLILLQSIKTSLISSQLLNRFHLSQMQETLIDKRWKNYSHGSIVRRVNFEQYSAYWWSNLHKNWDHNSFTKMQVQFIHFNFLNLQLDKFFLYYKRHLVIRCICLERTALNNQVHFNAEIITKPETTILTLEMSTCLVNLKE